MIAVKYVPLPLVSFILAFILYSCNSVTIDGNMFIWGRYYYWPYPEAKLFHPFPAIKAAPTEPIYLTILFLHP
jgi:hypothetical protein